MKASVRINIANVEIERISKGGFYKLGRVDFEIILNRFLISCEGAMQAL